ncbi:hypothetical protein [Kitasatospora sp. NPDC058397]|uniref:IS1634 family transposase n=1 Tax=unclassified Kitasatospora TaxID=2633591 RepID=UPI00365BBBFB
MSLSSAAARLMLSPSTSPSQPSRCASAIRATRLTRTSSRRGRLLTSSDPHLTAEEIAVGYKALLEAERGFRGLKTVLELRPVFHHLEHRIRAHVLLCWLALLLIRVAERHTGQTWNRISTELGRVHEVTLTGDAGQLTQTTPLTSEQATIYRVCGIKPPPRSPPQTPPDQPQRNRVGTRPPGHVPHVPAAQTPYRTPPHAFQLRKSGSFSFFLRPR